MRASASARSGPSNDSPRTLNRSFPTSNQMSSGCFAMLRNQAGWRAAPPSEATTSSSLPTAAFAGPSWPRCESGASICFAGDWSWQKR
jgi:hypothetical protein